VVERVEVLHHELLLQSYSGTLKKLWVQGGEHDVVDVEPQESSVGATVVHKQRGVQHGFHKTQGDQVGSEAVVPYSRCLLQAVEGLVEPAHQLRVRWVNEVGELRVVDDLRDCAMDEGILDIELVHGQPLEIARVSIVRTMAGLMMGLKVSL
jgi:hypothetical protein